MSTSISFLRIQRKKTDELERLAEQMAAAIVADETSSVESLRAAREFRDHQARLAFSQWK